MILREALRRQWGSLEMKYMESDQLSVTVRAVMNLLDKKGSLSDVREEGDVVAAAGAAGTETKGSQEELDRASYTTAIRPPEMLHTDLQRLMSFVEMRSPRMLAIVLKILGAFAADDYNLRVVIDRYVFYEGGREGGREEREGGRRGREGERERERGDEEERERQRERRGETERQREQG